ncbi:protein argonaute 12-like isoform X2 [Lotus japonicus]|uniref:protein argonaute 12-like isoform X2 n=1 Tax=Lotus japonicus TaxID=34305 RepID=UPI0025848922|nr:protein argonaute 12-like isoform X2 [Lotus japonicus]XP_057428490.1 protein argonaute 12-like isoform X2 [Lotus japonicus]
MTQCCKPEKVKKCSKDFLQSLALKINVKVGGINFVLREICKVTDIPTIIFGADVTHPEQGDDSSPSIAAVVASMDWPSVASYKCAMALQNHGQEILTDHSMYSELIQAFRETNSQLPKRIIFFRDGVAGTQFCDVLQHEVPNIRKACESIEEGYQPPLTFVIVHKRHHARFFPTENADGSGDILTGTVVDDKTICHSSHYHFYLKSHDGIPGTKSWPMRYTVLLDENNFTSDEIQQLVYGLCHTYARCPESVSVVPPVYYAHHAAYRARKYADGGLSLPKVKENIKKFMFYV